METDQDEQTVEMLVSEFYNFANIAAEHIIKQCRAVARAKGKGKNAFEEFCEKVKIKPGSSTTRKYVRIGAEADWLLPIADRLPADWTTIYDVVRLGQVKADEMVRIGVLHPQATAKQLTAAAIDPSDEIDSQGDAEVADTEDRCILEVDASELSDEDRLMLYRALEKATAIYGLAVSGLPDRLAESLILDRRPLDDERLQRLALGIPSAKRISAPCGS
jgi:hypothetical protein